MSKFISTVLLGVVALVLFVLVLRFMDTTEYLKNFYHTKTKREAIEVVRRVLKNRIIAVTERSLESGELKASKHPIIRIVRYIRLYIKNINKIFYG
jgi:hypothetical protein